MEIIDIRKKKADLCVEFMKLGMDFDTACVAAEIDPEMKDSLAADGDFVERTNFALARKEAELLRKFSEVAEANLDRGDTRQLERILEIINPERYSKVTKLAHQMGGSGNTAGKITVSFEGTDAQKED